MKDSARARRTDHRGQAPLARLGGHMVERPTGFGYQRGRYQQGQFTGQQRRCHKDLPRRRTGTLRPVQDHAPKRPPACTHAPH